MPGSLTLEDIGSLEDLIILRMECLRLAASLDTDPQKIIGIAQQFLEFVTTKTPTEQIHAQSDEQIAEKTPASIHSLFLTPRVRNALLGQGIKTVSDLVGRSEVELLGARLIGKGSLDEINEVLSQCGLSLRKP